MTQNLLSLSLTEAEWAQVDAALTILETILAAKLLDLTPEQRSRLTKMGAKSENFARQALIVSRQNADRLPPDTLADLGSSEADLAALDALRPRLTRLLSLVEKADDSAVALGSDIMVFCLTAYGVLKAIKAGGGLDELKGQMGTRFNRGPRPLPVPAPKPTA